MPFFTREKDLRECTQSTRKARGQTFAEQSLPLKQSDCTTTHMLASHCCQTCSEGKLAARHAGPTMLCEGKGLYCVYWFLSSFEKQRRKTQAPACSNKASALLTTLKVKAFQNSGVDTNQVLDREIIQITGSRQDKTEGKQKIERRRDTEYCCARYLYNDKNQY